MLRKNDNTYNIINQYRKTGGYLIYSYGTWERSTLTPYKIPPICQVANGKTNYEVLDAETVQTQNIV